MAEGYEPKPNFGFEIIEYTNKMTNEGGYIYLQTTNKILVYATAKEGFAFPLQNPDNSWFVRVFDGNLVSKNSTNIPSLTTLWLSN